MPRKSWWARLPFGLRMAAGTSGLLVLIGGGAAGIAAVTKDKPQVADAVGRESAVGAPATIASAAPEAVPAAPPAAGNGLGDARLSADRRVSDEADRTATRAPRRTGAADPEPAGAAAAAPKPPAAAPVVTTRTETETRSIPYRTRLVRDPSLPRGSHRVQTEGVPGIQTLRYLVTYADGRQTDRRLIDSAVTRQPQEQVIAFGPRGWHGGGGHDRECGPGLGACLPLGRSACPDDKPDDDKLEESRATELGGSVSVLDQDLALGDPDQLDGLELVC